MKETEKTVKLDFKVFTLDGEESLGGMSAAKFLAEKLVSRDSKQDFLRSYNIAQELYKKGKVTLSAEDLEFVRKFTKELRLQVFIKAPILIALED